jgi:type II secretory pathway component PulF
MNEISLPRVLAFNENLNALAAAGLPIDLGMDQGHEAIHERLEKFNESLMLRVARGQSIEQAIAQETALPSRYRAALWIWLRSGDPTIALDGIVAPAATRRNFGSDVSQALVYPLIVFILTFAGFLALCWLLVPRLEAMYRQIWQTPSESLAILIRCRETMPYWGPAVPLLVVLAVIAWRWRAPRASWRWVPGSAKYFHAAQYAELATQMANLLESGCGQDESLALLGPLYGSGADLESAPSESLPPLLRWAIRGDIDDQSRPGVLRVMAQAYRQSAEQQLSLWRLVAPSFCGALLGGMFVLAYGVGLFLPVVQLLKTIALPAGV